MPLSRREKMKNNNHQDSLSAQAACYPAVLSECLIPNFYLVNMPFGFENAGFQVVLE